MTQVWLNRILVCIAFWALTFSTIGTVPARAIAPNPAAFKISHAGVYTLPTLGAYPAASAAISGDITVSPAAAPMNTTGISASTNTNFKGTFATDPTTGVVTITNAHPAGVYTVTVKATGSGGSTSTTFMLTVNTGASCAGTSIVTGSKHIRVLDNPDFVAIGDFNNDGKQDVAIAHYDSHTAPSGRVSIRLGDGAGGFSISTEFDGGGGSRFLGIGDFNNDGNQDLAVVNYTQNSISIRFGDGSGGFSAATKISVANEPISIAIGDFNNDGNQDFAVANNNRKSVSIRLGDGSGGFSSAPDVSVGKFPMYIAIGDFNNDGNQDFITPNYGPPSTVSVRLGDGTGAFTKAADVSVNGATSVAIGDFNNDGNQDFSVANSEGTNVSIRIGDGTGGFSGITNVTVGSGPHAIAIGDFNNDGNQDIVTANEGSINIAVTWGNGAGGFSGATNVQVGAYAYSVAVGDFNNDGKQDVVSTSLFGPNLSVRLGACNFTVTFKANGGSGNMAPQASNVAANLTANAFTRTGYSFAGWNTAADGSGTAYADGASYPFTADVTLYAQWIVPLTVRINQATGQIDPTTVSPIHFTAVFSEGVTGFTSKDISFSGTTLTGTLLATVTEIAPNNGTAYDVAITGMIPKGIVMVNIPAGVVDSISRVGVVNQASTSRDNQVTFDYILVEFGASAAEDGWVLESTETSGVGGTMNSTATFNSVGDNASNRQYRSVLNFATDALPDNAVIAIVNLHIIQSSVVGINPFTTHGPLKSEIKSGFFGTADSLQTLDFQAAPDKLACNFETVPEIIESIGTAYRCVMLASAFPYINLTGTTQFRLRFTLDDDNDMSADTFNFYSGNFSNGSQRPRLFIKYYIPPAP